ncbi:MAG: hypothetical protein ACPG5U_07890 [Planktomarina sp.]
MNKPEAENTIEIDSKGPDGRRIYPLWYQDLLLGMWGEGFLEKKPNAAMIFVKRPRNFLLVTFDNLANVRDRAPSREPWACKFARDANISHLGVTVNAPNWFRDPWIIKRFQTLAADGFFDGYDRILFTGTSMGGFAALVFAQLVPAAHVAAFNPQSTLDPNIVPWETRFDAGRRQDWSGLFADGANGLDLQARTHVFYDPGFELDFLHAQRLNGPNVSKYNCRMSGHKSALFLNRMGTLPDIMRHMMFDSLNETQFYQYYRSRRKLYWWRNILREYYGQSNRAQMVETLMAGFTANLIRKENQIENLEDQLEGLEDD